MINVTKSFLPPLEEYTKYLEGIWDRVHLTNHGPLVTELEEKLRNFLGVKHFYFLSNGTVALQIAIKALDLKGEIITTPFSYVATTSSIVWENALPVFCDIDPRTLTIDENLVESLITPRTSAILATHVYGIPANVERLAAIAAKHNLRIIYDAAHAFGVSYRGKSIAAYGDLSTFSFHATKLFHTSEGGGIATDNDELAHRISYMRNFGHNGTEKFWGLGINGKNSEFHAAMGLCNFPRLTEIIQRRRELSQLYDSQLLPLSTHITRPVCPQGTEYNYAYYPIQFNEERVVLDVIQALSFEQIYPRRYFFPCLSQLPYLATRAIVPQSERISSCIICLPLFHDLSGGDVRRICKIISHAVTSHKPR